MQNKANFGQRLIAEMIDVLIGFSLTVWFLYLMSKTVDIQQMLNYGLNWILVGIWWSLILSFSQAFLISKFGASYGKLLTGLRIVDANGKKLSYWKAFFRELGLKKVSYYFLGLGYFWMIKDSQKQTWHDKALDTYVVVVNSPMTMVAGLVLASVIGLNVYGIVQIKNNVQANLPKYEEFYSEFGSLWDYEPKSEALTPQQKLQEAQKKQLEQQLKQLEEIEKQNQEVNVDTY
jgi:uncharacterized RDD family membrane protein YckC